MLQPRAALPPLVTRAIKKIGADISVARRRLGTYASILFVLGMTDRLTTLANFMHDPVGCPSGSGKRMPFEGRAERHLTRLDRL
jgi:hypothetical protein